MLSRTNDAAPIKVVLEMPELYGKMHHSPMFRQNLAIVVGDIAWVSKSHIPEHVSYFMTESNRSREINMCQL
jgi:hypothetical protein